MDGGVGPSEGTPVHVRFTKWDGSLHWHFDTVRLGEDVHGIWLGGADGTPVRRGDEPSITSPAFALLIPEEQWWTATFNTGSATSPFGYTVYVDICTPARWEGSTVSSIDLDLDVGRRFDGAVEILDEDEFEEHRAAFDYPPNIVDGARTAAARLFTAVESRAEPFDEVGPGWLERALEIGR